MAYIVAVVAAGLVAGLSLLWPTRAEETTAAHLTIALEDPEVQAVAYISEENRFEWTENGTRYSAEPPEQIANDVRRHSKVVPEGNRRVPPAIRATLFALGGALLAAPWGMQIGLAIDALRSGRSIQRRLLWAIGLLMVPVVVPLAYLLTRGSVGLEVVGVPLLVVVAVALGAGVLLALQGDTVVREVLERPPLSLRF